MLFRSWILYELVQNGEIYNPKSCYAYKDRSGKLHMGPAWDFDMCLQTLYYERGLTLKNTVWYGGLFKNQSFVDLVKHRWNEHKSVLQTIPDYIDIRFSEIEESADINSKIWPINLWYIEAPFRNGEEGMTHRESVEEVKRKYNVRFNIVDAAINSL